jgi:hypothetical protein
MISSTAASRRRPVREGRTEPDAIDRMIFDLLRKGIPPKHIATHIGQCYAAITKRIDWVRARRWSSFDGVRILEPEERERLLDAERDALTK